MSRATFIVLNLLLATLFLLPAASAQGPLPTGTGVEGECVWLYSFPDAGSAYCVDRDDSDDCLIYHVEVTLAGPRTTCIVADP